MRFDVITLFPDMFDAIRQYGVTGKAMENGLVELNCWNPREYTQDKRSTVDDRPFGGGPGMVMMVQPLREAINKAKATAKAATSADSHVIYLSPQGRKLDYDGLKTLSTKKSLVLLTGRYEGIDERIIETDVDEEWSIGDYVLTGGELPAMVIIDALTRLIPGALGHEDAAVQDSFVDGILDCPHYSRPVDIDGQAVPEVLLSGNHKLIEQWRRKQALGRTWLKRPDLLEELDLSDSDKAQLEEFITEQKH